MSIIKSIFKCMASRIWFIVTSIVITLLLVASILASTTFYQIICVKLGSERTSGRGEGSYYEITAQSKEDAYNRGNKLNEQICEEGFVLLKNAKINGKNALPLSASEKKISVFGKNSVNLVYGGTGSGGGKYSGAPTIYSGLEKAGFDVNPTLKAFYENNSLSDKGRAQNPKIENSGNVTLSSGETAQSRYTQSVKDSYANYNSAAIVIFSRIGGEGFDLPRTMVGTEKHYLELDDNETALIAAVKNASFKKVIVVLNASTTMEVGALEKDEGIHACISAGGSGFSGIDALGSILNGAVNPSGKTVDLWAADFTKNPTYFNFGNNLTENGANYFEEGKPVKYFFVDYEEGIYLGYRYYETRGEKDEAWYNEQVVYPFGYGLSYTDFSWEIVNSNALKSLTINEQNKNTEIEIDVKVTNIGNSVGKDVVELYCSAPKSEIEKPSSVLCGFEKTPLLYPVSEANANKPNSVIVKIKFNPYYAASYDYKDANKDGYAGYVLDSGKYLLNLKTDSHTLKANVEAIEIAVSNADIKYSNDPVTGKEVLNRFDDASEELDTILSAKDWDKTWPTTPKGHNFEDYSFNKNDLNSLATNNPKTDWQMPTTEKKTNKKIIEMRNLDYDDPQWEEILDALTFTEMKDLYNNGAFKTVGIERLGLPATIAADGPVGFTNFISDVDIYGTVSYCSQYVMGCTWNKELIKDMGCSVGEEGGFGKTNIDPYVPYSGWYAPGINLHRSPFGGRNFEYFSEDPYLSGFLAAAEISGAKSKGLITYIKHFALNEQETYRDDNGICTWASEQAMRELYLKPFEIAVKEGGSNGVMTSFNRIGTKWTGGDYRLVTDVLRGEWGFKGSVISDFNVSIYMNAKLMAYAGGDLNLTTTRPWFSPSSSSAADVSVLRKAAHNVLYSVVNSNAMNGVDINTVFKKKLPLWQIALIIGDCAILVTLGAWGAFAIRKSLKKAEGTG